MGEGDLGDVAEEGASVGPGDLDEASTECGRDGRGRGIIATSGSCEGTGKVARVGQRKEDVSLRFLDERAS